MSQPDGMPMEETAGKSWSTGDHQQTQQMQQVRGATLSEIWRLHEIPARSDEGKQRVQQVQGQG